MVIMKHIGGFGEWELEMLCVTLSFMGCSSLLVSASHN